MLGTKFKSFFKKNKEKIRDSEITICMGNEGCDLDSFISSLVVAYAENVIHVVPIKKDIFLAKGELIHVCKKFQIDINDLIYIERPVGAFSVSARKVGTYFRVENEEVQIKDKQIKLFLTDHNEPIEEFKDCDIEMIIDHHVLSNCIHKSKRIYIDIDVGSATTLVSKYLGNDLAKKVHCFSNYKKRKDSSWKDLCSQIAYLLLIPIIIDTNFLTKRTSHFDYREYKKLKRISCIKKKELKTEYKKIKKSRKNDGDLKSELIIQKDFKKYKYLDFTFGSSTIKYNFETWADRESKHFRGFEPSKSGMCLFMELESFRNDMGLDFYYVSTKRSSTRYIIILDFPYIKDLMETCDMKKIEYEGLVYYKLQASYTRKIMIPIIRKIIEKHSQK